MKVGKELIEKYLSGQCNEQERAIVESWYNQTANSQEANPVEDNLFNTEKEIWKNIHPKRSFFSSYKAALSVAATVLVISAITIIFLKQDEQFLKPQETGMNSQILTGGKKAILTMANGEMMNLDNLILKDPNRVFSVEEIMSTLRISDDVSSGHVSTLQKIDIPKGGEFHFKLSDGTLVWLNSESSFSFPNKFENGVRKVVLSGEGYFEVAKDKTKPFKVMANGTEVTVLGTHFNVSSYEGERQTTVTLAEGSVRVNNEKSSVLLTPNQSAVSADLGKLKVSNVNVAEVIAWKEGFFVFDNSDIKSIMKTLSRWYDFEIEYKGVITTKKFGGTFSRSKNIKDLLSALESFGAVHFSIEGRRVVVMP